MKKSTEPQNAPWDGSHALFQAWRAREITTAAFEIRREVIAARVRRYIMEDRRDDR